MLRSQIESIFVYYFIKTFFCKQYNHKLVVTTIEFNVKVEVKTICTDLFLLLYNLTTFPHCYLNSVRTSLGRKQAVYDAESIHVLVVLFHIIHTYTQLRKSCMNDCSTETWVC